nr:MAG: major capsid protein [Microvirus Sku13]
MSNPFVVNKEKNNNVPRYGHDRSFFKHASFAFGKLYPVLCEEVLPGESIRINSSFGLQALPMVFPVQSAIRASIHYFYVRNRNLYKDWQDFIFNTKQNLTQPRIGKNSPISFATGSLADYLGVPTRLPQNVNAALFFPIDISSSVKKESSDYAMVGVPSGSTAHQYFLYRSYENIRNTSKRSSSLIKYAFVDFSNLRSLFSSGDTLGESIKLKLISPFITGVASSSKCEIIVYDDSTDTYLSSSNYLQVEKSSTVEGEFFITLPVNWLTHVVKDLGSSLHRCIIYFESFAVRVQPKAPDEQTFFMQTKDSYAVSDIDLSSVARSVNPFLNGWKPLLAYPFRVYESIYNAFYRNQQLDPLLDAEGRPEYNDFLVNKEGGEDNDMYDFHYKLWESDIFTSCLPSPQQGAAPLVGIVNAETQSIAFRDEDGNVRYVKPNVSKDGQSLESIDVSDEDKNIEVLSIERAVMQGISINDFRNVNAFQKYLELNLRKGFRYKDLVKGHFDVDIRYDELNMPEFLGGVSQDLNVTRIISSSDTLSADGGKPLGAIAGNADMIGKQNHTITKYCDEAGFIMGVLCITPVPVYTQVLPPYFSRYTYLDYFTPEFANIGMTPILKSDLSPLQAFTEDPTKINDVFGYQQPWASYKRNLDTAHGLFRTELRNMLLNRTFDSVPKLGKEFIEIRPRGLNDIFASTLENEDKFYGQLYFDISVKSPVPFISNPRID